MTASASPEPREATPTTPDGGSGRLLVLALVALLFCAHLAGLALADRSIIAGQIIAGDGLLYYEFLPSIILDGDLDFSNQRATVQSLGVPYFWGAGYLGRTGTGLYGTPFTVGWALLTAPFFVAGHLLSLAAAAAGIDVRLDGYSWLDQFATNLGAVLYGLAGVFLCYRALRTTFDDITSGLAVSAFVCCSNLPYYLIVHASMSHGVAFFCMDWATCSFMEVLRGRASELSLGLACGLACLVRPQLAPIVLTLYAGLVIARPIGLPRLAASAVTCAAVVSLQLVVWKIIYGAFVLIPQGNTFLTPATPHIAELLFSLNHGLVSWTPFTGLALAGLLTGAIVGRLRLVFAVFLLGIASQIYINAIALDWWGGNAFGMRRMIETYPLMMFGVGGLVAIGPMVRSAVMAFALACAIFNALFFVQYRFCYIPRDRAITLRQLFADKLALHRLERPYCQSTSAPGS